MRDAEQLTSRDDEALQRYASRVQAVVDRGAAPVVSVIRGDTLRIEPVHWLWRGWLAAGKLAMLGGAPGCGKTTITMSLAGVVTTGGKWPDGSRCAAPGCVLVWSGEDDPQDTLLPRLKAAGADLSRVFFITTTQDHDGTRSFDPARDMAALEDQVEKIHDLKLLIVDPIVSAVAGDSHKNAEVRRSLQPLVDFAARKGCAVLGITHFTKGTGGRDPAERINGSLAFVALSRIVIVAAKESQTEDGEEARRVFVRAKSNIGEDGGGFVYALEASEVAPGVVGTSIAWRSQIDGSAREILADVEACDTAEDSGALGDAKAFLSSLLEGGPRPQKQIKSDADGAGFSWATIRRAKDALEVVAERDGFGGGGKWMWALRCSQSSKGDHTKNMSTFGGNEHLWDATASTPSIDAQKTHRCSSIPCGEHMNTYGDDVEVF